MGKKSGKMQMDRNLETETHMLVSVCVCNIDIQEEAWLNRDLSDQNIVMLNSKHDLIYSLLK